MWYCFQCRLFFLTKILGELGEKIDDKPNEKCPSCGGRATVKIFVSEIFFNGEKFEISSLLDENADELRVCNIVTAGECRYSHDVEKPSRIKK